MLQITVGGTKNQGEADYVVPDAIENGFRDPLRSAEEHDIDTRGLSRVAMVLQSIYVNVAELQLSRRTRSVLLREVAFCNGWGPSTWVTVTL